MVLLSRNPNNCICRQQPEAVGRGASGSWGTPPPSLLNRVRNLMLGQDNLDKNVEEFILHSQTELQQHVMQHIKQYEAMMMIIGRLAGIPACGTPEEIKAARDAVEAALKNLNADLANRSKREGWSGYISPLDLLSLGMGYYYQGYGTVEEWFGDAIGVEGIKNSGRSNQNIGEGLVATDPDKYIGYAISDFLTSVWSSAEQYYNNFLKEVETNGFLIAYGKLHIDAGFLAAELAIDIALGAVTGGAGAAASRIIRVVGTRVGRTATRVVVKIGKQGDGVIPNGRILLDEIVDDVDIPNDIDIIIDENNLGGGARLDDTAQRVEPNAITPNTTIINGQGRNTAIIDIDPATNRPRSVSATIMDDAGANPRGDNATEIGRLGNEGDHGGHLIAHRFMGDVPDSGIVPQAGNLNTGAWKKMENEWADWINKYQPAEGNHVEIDVNIDIDPPGAVRPNRFDVEYNVYEVDASGNRTRIHRNRTEFENQPSESFDRVYFRTDGTVREN